MFRFIKSIIKSAFKGISQDSEIQRLANRYPRFFGFIKKRLTPDEKFGLYLTIGSIITLFFGYLFFGVFRDIIGQKNLLDSDLRIINLIQMFRTPELSWAILFITYMGKWQIVIIGVTAVGILMTLYRRWHYLIGLLVSVGGGEFFVWVIKHFVERPRPPLVNAIAPEDSFSFPSGHTFVAISFYGFLTYLLIKKTKSKILKIITFLIGLALILLISFSRIYLGAHWPSDVSASLASGAAWLTVVITALEIRKKFNNRPHQNPILPKIKIALIGIMMFILWGCGLWYYFIANPPKNPITISQKPIYLSGNQIPQSFFNGFPRTSENILGHPIEPINIIIIASKDSMDKAFKKAGWTVSDNINPRSLKRLIIAGLMDKPYPGAPGIPSFWDAKPNDFAYEQPTPTNNVKERHHIHIWQTPFVVDRKPVWLGTAHFDRAVKLKTLLFLPVHQIDPAIDKERERVKNDLASDTASWQKFKITDPILGKNSVGDEFFTDGEAYVLTLKD